MATVYAQEQGYDDGRRTLPCRLRPLSGGTPDLGRDYLRLVFAPGIRDAPPLGGVGVVLGSYLFRGTLGANFHYFIFARH